MIGAGFSHEDVDVPDIKRHNGLQTRNLSKESLEGNRSQWALSCFLRALCSLIAIASHAPAHWRGDEGISMRARSPRCPRFGSIKGMYAVGSSYDQLGISLTQTLVVPNFIYFSSKGDTDIRVLDSSKVRRSLALRRSMTCTWARRASRRSDKYC